MGARHAIPQVLGVRSDAEGQEISGFGRPETDHSPPSLPRSSPRRFGWPILGACGADGNGPSKRTRGPRSDNPLQINPAEREAVNSDRRPPAPGPEAPAHTLRDLERVPLLIAVHDGGRSPRAARLRPHHRWLSIPDQMRSPKSPRGEFSEPLAVACHAPEALRHVLKRPGTVDNLLQVDGLAEWLSAFGHGDDGKAVRHRVSASLRDGRTAPKRLRDDAVWLRSGPHGRSLPQRIPELGAHRQPLSPTAGLKPERRSRASALEEGSAQAEIARDGSMMKR